MFPEIIQDVKFVHVCYVLFSRYALHVYVHVRITINLFQYYTWNKRMQRIALMQDFPKAIFLTTNPRIDEKKRHPNKCYSVSPTI